MRCEPSLPETFRRIVRDGSVEDITRDIVAEVPVAIEVNGAGYAVLMATPGDLEDLAYGFALADRLIDRADDVAGVDVHDADGGMLVRLTLVQRCAARVLDRVRHRASDSSCGLCGVETLAQAVRALPVLPVVPAVGEAAIFAAFDALGAQQPLGARTAAAHAAAWCDGAGAVRRVREDVGRHNAFDKLIGSMLRGGDEWGGGFALLTSRCSYELVEKAVLAECPTLATISAPTALAVARARAAGLHLRVLVRGDALLAV